MAQPSMNFLLQIPVEEVRWTPQLVLGEGREIDITLFEKLQKKHQGTQSLLGNGHAKQI
jgi:hypothetical protein